MPGEAIIINPTPRRGKGGRFVKTRKRSAPRKRRSTAKRRYRKNPVATESRRRSVSRARPRARIRRDTARRVRRSYRRNPMPRFSVRNILGTVQDAAMGAGGSLLTDAAFTYIPMPAVAKAGNIGLVTRAAMAFATGWLASFVVGGARAKKLTEGALTVQIANLAKAQISSRFLPLAGDEELGYVSAGMIGEYLSGNDGTFAPPYGAPALGEYLSAYSDEADLILADEYRTY